MTIQRLIAAGLTLLFTSPLLAQKDTTIISTTTEEGVFIPQQFVDEYDFVFLNKEPLRFMAKWNTAAALPVLNTDWQILGGGEGFDDLRLEGAFEIKLGQALSVNALFNVQIAGETDNFLESFTFGVEPRYYFRQKRRIRQGKSANNLTGVYTSLSFTERTNLFKPGFWPEGQPYEYNDYTLTARIGFQQRIFKSGYIDFNWGIGSETRTNIKIATNNIVTFERKWRAHFDQRLTMGWAFGSPKAKRYDNRSCDFFKCFQEESRLLKIDMLNLVRTLSFRQQSGKLSVAIEQKIGSSPFSVQLAGDLLGSRNNLNPDFKRTGYGGGVSAEPRWFYSQKKRIATGKSGNNLNGPFIGINVGYVSSQQIDDQQSVDYVYQDQVVRLVPVFGLQYRIFDKGFAEYRVGVGMSHYRTDIDYRNTDNPVFDPGPSAGNEIYFLSELKIGFAF